MKFLPKFAIALAALTIAPAAMTAEMKIDTDGMAVIDGNRTFILGLYEDPADDAALAAAAGAGINLVHAAASGAALDRLHQAGIWAWLTTGYDIDLSEDADAKRARLAEAVENFGGHPALAVWEVPDEALWNAWYLAEIWRLTEEPKAQRAAVEALDDATLAETLASRLDEVKRLYRHGKYAEGEASADSIWAALGQDIPRPGYGLSTAPERARALGDGMVAGYRVLREMDPAHPVWMNHAPRNTISDLAHFNRGADIVGCDIYPVPESALIRHSDLANRTLGAVGAYTERMQAAAPGKPVWMVLQGTGWGDFQTDLSEERREALRRPRKDETRFMAYDAIVHGARGILYWGTAYVEKDSEFWRELLEVVGELDGLQAVLSAPDAAPPAVTLGPTHGSIDRGVVVRTKAAPDGEWHLVVNEWEGPLEVTLAGTEPNCYRVDDDEVVLAEKDGSLSFHMPAYSVVVLRPASAEAG